MTTNATEYAIKLIKDNPNLFNKFCDRELLETKIALALTDFSLQCLSTKNRDEFEKHTEQATQEEIREEIEGFKEVVTEDDLFFNSENFPPVFDDIINSHFNIKTK